MKEHMKEQKSYEPEESEYYKQSEKEFFDLLQQIKSGNYQDNKLVIGAIECGYGDTSQNLHDEQALLLAEALKTNPNITIINLYGHNIGDVGASALASVKSIEELDLSENPIGAEGVEELANSNLKKLILCGSPNLSNESEYPQFIKMIDALIDNKTIIELNLDCCYIPSEMIARLIKYNKTIKTLILGTGITDEAFLFIENNKTLKTLHISKGITDKGAEYVSKNTSLEKIGIAQSKITDIGAKLLSTHPSLKELYIHDSDITTQGVKYFFDSKLDNFLIETNLKQDILSRDQCNYINREFGNLKEEQELQKQFYFQGHPEMDIELSGNTEEHGG